MSNVYNKSTQSFLNYYLEGLITPLKVDGNIGNKSKAATTLFIECLRNRFRLDNLIWNDNQVLAIRTNDNYTDLFDDWFVVIKKDLIYAISCSTKAGYVSMLKNTYKFIGGKQGVAVLKEGQYLNTWQLNGAWWSGLKFFQQILPVTIYRDNILNNVIDREQEETGLYGINLHSWIHFNSNNVSNLSEGCVVAKQADWLYILNLIPISSNGLINSFTLLNGVKDLIQIVSEVHNVYFYNYGGELITVQRVNNNSVISYPEAPIKKSDDYFNYTFAYWYYMVDLDFGNQVDEYFVYNKDYQLYPFYIAEEIV